MITPYKDVLTARHAILIKSDDHRQVKQACKVWVDHVEQREF